MKSTFSNIDELNVSWAFFQINTWEQNKELMGTKLTIFTKFPFHVGFFCTNISEGIGDWLHMARLDNQYKTWNKYLGWHIRSVQQLKEIFHFFQRNTQIEKTLAWSKWCTYCAHINDSEAKQGAAEKYWKEMERNITRRCTEIFEGNGEKYYKKMHRNILRRCWEMLCSELRGKVTFWQLRSQRV